MRLIVVAIAFLAMASPGWAGKTPVHLKCSAPDAHMNAGGKQVAAVGGACSALKKVGGQLKRRPLKPNFFYQYRLYDQANNSCGATESDSGRLLLLKVSPSQLRIRFGIAPKGLAKKVWGKWTSFNLGGNDLQCGTSVSSPAPTVAQLCAWPDGDLLIPGGSTGACGEPVPGACRWASASTLSDNVVLAGTVECPQAPCHYSYDKRSPVTWFTPEPVAVPISLDCPGGSGAAVGLADIRLGHYEGDKLVIDCEAKPDAIAAIRFGISPGWGGVLLTQFRLYPYAAGRALGKFETQTSLFKLTGTKSGCPLALAPINGPPGVGGGKP